MLKMEVHMLIWYFGGFANSYHYKKDSFKAFLEETKLKNLITFMYYKAHTQIQELKGQQNAFVNFIFKKLLRPLQFIKSYSILTFVFLIHSLEKEDLLESAVEEGMP